MRSTISEEIATLLEQAGFGIIGDSLFCSRDTPPKPDRKVIVLIDGTVQPDMVNIDIQHVAFRVVCRDGRGQQNRCEGDALRIKGFLSKIGNKRVLGSVFINIKQIAGPLDASNDITMRPTFISNFVLDRTEGTTEVEALGTNSAHCTLFTR